MPPPLSISSFLRCLSLGTCSSLTTCWTTSSHHLSAQVYSTTFLNAVCSFYDLEEYPIDIAGIFMDHIDPRLANGFWINYPDFGKARARGALAQRTLLTDMLSALIKMDNSISNILDIITDARGGKQFLINPPPGGLAPAFPSVAETTLQRYA